MEFFSFFLTLISSFLWGQNYIVRANKVLLFLRYNINNNKKGKKVRNTTLAKCIFDQIWELKPDSTW